MRDAAILNELDDTARTLILRTARTLWKFPQVKRVVLYGSQAKQTQTRESDIDMAAFVADESYGKALFKQVVKACTVAEMDVQVQIFPMADLDMPCGIIEEILEFGVDMPRELFPKAVSDGE